MTLDNVQQKIQAALQRDPLTAQDVAEAQVWATLSVAVVLRDFADDFRRVQMDLKRQTDRQLEPPQAGGFATPKLQPQVQQ